MSSSKHQKNGPQYRDIYYNASIVSKLLQMQNDPFASLSTKQHAMNYPMREEEVTEDEKLPKGIECVLKHSVAKAESGGKSTVVRCHPRKRRRVIRQNPRGKKT